MFFTKRVTPFSFQYTFVTEYVYYICAPYSVIYLFKISFWFLDAALPYIFLALVMILMTMNILQRITRVSILYLRTICWHCFSLSLSQHANNSSLTSIWYILVNYFNISNKNLFFFFLKKRLNKIKRQKK